jgi:hypothetical protein
VDVAEVGRVDGVLRHLLEGGVDLVAGAAHVGPVRVAVDQRGLLGHVPQRLGVLRVVPGHDQAVALHRGVGVEVGLAVEPLAVGDGGVGALGVELPAVERAADLAAEHRSTVAEVGAEVRAEGVVEVERAVLVPPADQVPRPVVERLRLAHREVVRVAHAEPAERDGEGVAVRHHGS